MRLIQVAGTVGLLTSAVCAALGGVQLPVVLALLGGAVLFPLIVWLLGQFLRGARRVWLMRAALIVVFLPLAALGMIWLLELITTDRLARMEPARNFVAELASAEIEAPGTGFVRNDYFDVDGDERRVLFMHPDSRVRYLVKVPAGGLLAFDIATAPESWNKPGDGVAFALYVESQQGAEQVFSAYIDPKRDESARHWHSHTVDLGEYAGQTVTLIFETGSGPAGDDRYDWAGWGLPRLLAP
jgi:hypothetical protein